MSNAKESKQMRYAKTRPDRPGWYWFQVGDDSPCEMTRLVEAVVWVCDPDPDLPGTRLVCRFIQGDFNLLDMGGMFAGPLRNPNGATPTSLTPRP